MLQLLSCPAEDVRVQINAVNRVVERCVSNTGEPVVRVRIWAGTPNLRALVPTFR